MVVEYGEWTSEITGLNYSGVRKSPNDMPVGSPFVTPQQYYSSSNYVSNPKPESKEPVILPIAIPKSSELYADTRPDYSRMAELNKQQSSPEVINELNKKYAAYQTYIRNNPTDVTLGNAYDYSGSYIAGESGSKIMAYNQKETFKVVGEAGLGLLSGAATGTLITYAARSPRFIGTVAKVITSKPVGALLTSAYLGVTGAQAYKQIKAGDSYGVLGTAASTLGFFTGITGATEIVKRIDTIRTESMINNFYNKVPTYNYDKARQRVGAIMTDEPQTTLTGEWYLPENVFYRDNAERINQLLINPRERTKLKDFIIQEQLPSVIVTKVKPTNPLKIGTQEKLFTAKPKTSKQINFKGEPIYEEPKFIEKEISIGEQKQILLTKEEPIIKIKSEVKPELQNPTVIPKTESTTVIGYTPSFFNKIGLKSKTALRQEFIQSYKQEIAQATKQDLLQNTRQNILQSTKNDMLLGTKQNLIQATKQEITQSQKQNLKTNLITGLKLRENTITKIPILELKPEAIIGIKSISNKDIIKKAYITLLKRKGKYSAISKPTTLKAALDIGARVGAETLAASFKIKRVNAMPIEIQTSGEFNRLKNIYRSYKIRKGIKIPLAMEFIQKRGTRLGRRGEVLEIQRARRRFI